MLRGVGARAKRFYGTINTSSSRANERPILSIAALLYSRSLVVFNDHGASAVPNAEMYARVLS